MKLVSLRGSLGFLLLAIAVTACGGESGTDGLKTVSLSESAVALINNACRRQAGAVETADQAAAVGPLEDIWIALGDNPEASDLRTEVYRLGEKLEYDGLRSVAEDLNSLSRVLARSGAEDCDLVGALTAQINPPSPEAAQADLEAASMKWRDQNIQTYSVTTYSTNYRSLPECQLHGSVLTIVRDDQVVAVINQLENCSIGPSTVVDRPLRIEDLFSEITAHPDANSVIVFYDSELGYPSSIDARYDSYSISIRVQGFQVGDASLRKAAALGEALLKNQQRWQVLDVTHYKMVVELSCFCEDRGPWAIEVLDGNILSIDPSGPSWLGKSYVTVDGIQTQIGANIYAHGLNVTYDSRGIPITVYIDPDGNTIDDELEITISEFEELP